MTALTLLLAAVDFSAERHKDQRRKGSDAEPYINHPVRVAHLLSSVGGVTDVELLCAAVLHDTVEDVGVTPDELRERFGDAVTALVLEVTDDKSLAKDERKRRQVEHAPHLSERAKQLKLADKLANVTDILERPPTSWELQRRVEYFAWAHAVVEGLRGANAALEAAFDAVYARRPGQA